MQHIKKYLSRRMLKVLGIALLVTYGQSPVFAQAASGACGQLRAPGQYGPYDYRTDHDKLPIVLGAHFTPAVESLIRGTTSRLPGPDISYTLRAIPNNHRALIAMMRLGEKEKTSKPFGSSYDIGCWFERAVLFAPDDAIVRMIYSTYLNSKGQVSEAGAQLGIATGYAKDNPFTHYNIGLHYLDIKYYDQALVQAHKAMSLGFNKSELKDELTKIGKWTEPVEVSASPTPAASAATVQLK